MLRTAQPVRGFMPLAFLLSLLGACFTSWSAWGNAIALCFTAGCTIYQDVTVAGVSVWWIGTGAFALLALLAIAGRPGLALFVSTATLFLDCLLLLLLAVTAPCVACLIAGIFFALTYAAFRNSASDAKFPPSRSWLLLFWSFLLVANLLNVARSEMGTWAIKEAADPSVKLYFSPSCTACQEGIRVLSGRTDVSFYAVSKSEQDTLLIAAMKRAVQRGASMAEALRRAPEVPAPTGVGLYAPDMLLLRFALLRNNSYALNAGGGVLPLLEHLGLPQGNVLRSLQTDNPPAPPRASDSTLPTESEAPAQCSGNTPCP
ncbi:MAG: hypothetical protein LBH94_01300 [Deltaproteobacteria bacterium]|jgi:hypothetical protein|nr:hypothetical protein [Deltaproteobacteria bacterium]